MLHSLELTNFRNYTGAEFTFDRQTVFIGQNGIGKTNILEAISYIALARSFRTRLDREIIRWGESVARLVAKTEGEAPTELEIVLGQEVKGGKLIKINGVSRRAIELLGHIAVVLFLPMSLQLVDGAPPLRRHWLDLLLIQEDRRYAYHLLQLQKVLRQRNRLLRQIDEGQAAINQLVFWDASLVLHGSSLVASRVRALQALNTTLSDQYQTMSQKEGSLRLEYKVASVSESSGEQDQYRLPEHCSTDPATWAKLLGSTLEKYQYREIAANASLYGPQRDDIVFMLNNRPLASYGSRGEHRSAILALKAAEADYLMNFFRADDDAVPLVFLLDDVYSELDAARRSQLTKLIGNHQAVITTTDLTHLDRSIQKSAKIINLP